jgi:hypothetical protein
MGSYVKMARWVAICSNIDCSLLCWGTVLVIGVSIIYHDVQAKTLSSGIFVLSVSSHFVFIFVRIDFIFLLVLIFIISWRTISDDIQIKSVNYKDFYNIFFMNWYFQIESFKWSENWLNYGTFVSGGHL